MRILSNRHKSSEIPPNDGLQLSDITLEGKFNGEAFKQHLKLENDLSHQESAVSQQESTDTKNTKNVDSASSNTPLSNSGGNTSFQSMYKGFIALLKEKKADSGALKSLGGKVIPEENQREAVLATDLIEFVSHLGLGLRMQGTVKGQIRGNQLEEYMWDYKENKWVDPKAKSKDSFVSSAKAKSKPRKVVPMETDETTEASQGGTSLQEIASKSSSVDSSDEDEKFDEEMLRNEVLYVFPSMYDGLIALLKEKKVDAGALEILLEKTVSEEKQKEAVLATNLEEFVSHLGLGQTTENPVLNQIRARHLQGYVCNDEDQWVDPQTNNASESESFV